MAHAIRPTYAYREISGRQLYVVGEPDHPVVKIGISLQPEARLRSLHLSLHPDHLDMTKLVLLHRQAGTRRLEAELHYRFGSRRVVGEWFDLGVLAVPLIKSAIRDLGYPTSRNPE